METRKWKGEIEGGGGGVKEGRYRGGTEGLIYKRRDGTENILAGFKR